MTLTFEWFLILSFAAYRASRAVALDTITEPLRDRLTAWSFRRPKAWRTFGGDFQDEPTPWKAKVVELVSCGFCSGFWLAGVTYLVWLLVIGGWDDAPVLVHGIVWWAIAGAQAMLVAVDSFLLREAPPGDS